MSLTSLLVLPPLSANNLTVTGVSSGAYFANQFQIAFSNDVIGGGYFAGGPYYCAMNNLITATNYCMDSKFSVPVKTLVQWTKNASSLKYIDNYKNLKNSKIWIFSGVLDSVVDPQLGIDNLNFYYEIGTDQQNVKTVFDVEAEHSWVVFNNTKVGGECEAINEPYYLNNCARYEVLDMVEWLYGKPQDYGVIGQVRYQEQDDQGQLYEFDQTEFCPNQNCQKISMANTGYIYIPNSCKDTQCKLMITFHGCKMGNFYIGDVFAENSGLNYIANYYKMIIVYPQAIPSNINPSNPNGCWDWWGYTNSLYAVKSGPQLKVVRAMAERLMSPSF